MPRQYISISEKESEKAIDLIYLIDKLKDVKRIKNLQNIIEELDENELIDMYRKRSEMPIRGVSKKPKVICNLCNCKDRNGGLWEHKQSKKCKRMIALNELKDIKRKTAKIDDNGEDLLNLPNRNIQKKRNLIMKQKYIELVIKLNGIYETKYEDFKNKMEKYPIIKKKKNKKKKKLKIVIDF